VVSVVFQSLYCWGGTSQTQSERFEKINISYLAGIGTPDRPSRSLVTIPTELIRLRNCCAVRTDFFVGLSKVLKFRTRFVERPRGICGEESGTGQVWEVEGSRSCWAAICSIGGAECWVLPPGLWFVDAFS